MYTVLISCIHKGRNCDAKRFVNFSKVMWGEMVETVGRRRRKRKIKGRRKGREGGGD